MTTNPNPLRITDAMWMLWEQSEQIIPGVRLGGIYADKRGYHNTVNANRLKWPGNYSITLPLDLNAGPKDKARGIDLTMSTAEMIKRTEYLRQAARHPDDNRLGAVRELYGTLDGNNVFGLIRDSSGTWNAATSDTSHLWHIHMGIFTAYCASWEALRPIVTVLDGMTWEQWLEANDMTDTRVRIESTESEYNTSVWITDGNARRRVRAPGDIHRGVKVVFPVEVVLNDAHRLMKDGTFRPWENYLDGVLGYDLEVQHLSLKNTLDQILAAALDDGNVEVKLTPELIAALQAFSKDIKEETRDAVADLGEGGSVQVRADE